MIAELSLNMQLQFLSDTPNKSLQSTAAVQQCTQRRQSTPNHQQQLQTQQTDKIIIHDIHKKFKKLIFRQMKLMVFKNVKFNSEIITAESYSLSYQAASDLSSE